MKWTGRECDYSTVCFCQLSKKNEEDTHNDCAYGHVLDAVVYSNTLLCFKMLPILHVDITSTVSYSLQIILTCKINGVQLGSSLHNVPATNN